MINIEKIVGNLEVIIGDYDSFEKITILCNKAKIELLSLLNLTESEIYEKYIENVEDIIGDMALYKYNTLDKQGLQSEKFDVISIVYKDNDIYPSSLLNKIDNLSLKLTGNTIYTSTNYATLFSPFLF